MATLAEMVVRLTGDSRQLVATLRTSDNAIAQFGTRSSGVLQNLQKNWLLVAGGVAATGAALGGSAALITKWIGLASDLGEEQSKAAQVFGNSADAVKRFAEAADVGFGLSERSALQGASAMGAMFNAVGLSNSAAADMSVTMTKLAADMASFNNQDPSEMLVRLRSGLAGEAEPLRQFGVFLSAQRVEAKALEMQLAKTKGELTEAMKVQARYALILEDTSRQQGDFARTGDGMANQLRKLSAQWENFQGTLGEAFLPVATDMISALNDWMATNGDDFAQDIATALTGVAQATQAVIGGLRVVKDILEEIDRIPGIDLKQISLEVVGIAAARDIHALISDIQKEMDAAALSAERWHAAAFTHEVTAALDDTRIAAGGLEGALARLGNAFLDDVSAAAFMGDARNIMRDTTLSTEQQREAVIALSKEYRTAADAAALARDATRIAGSTNDIVVMRSVLRDLAGQFEETGASAEWLARVDEITADTTLTVGEMEKAIADLVVEFGMLPEAARFMEAVKTVTADTTLTVGEMVTKVQQLAEHFRVSGVDASSLVQEMLGLGRAGDMAASSTDRMAGSLNAAAQAARAAADEIAGMSSALLAARVAQSLFEIESLPDEFAAGVTGVSAEIQQLRETLAREGRLSEITDMLLGRGAARQGGFGGGGGGGGSSFSPTPEDPTAALKQDLFSVLGGIQRDNNRDLYQAYLTGGKAQVDVVRSTQQEMLAAARDMAIDLRNTFGIELPEALTVAMEHLKQQADEVQDASRSLRTGGLLADLLAISQAEGTLNQPGSGATFTASAAQQANINQRAALIVQGDLNVAAGADMDAITDATSSAAATAVLTRGGFADVEIP